MPTVWKILSKKFLLNILFFTFFFVALTVFFKLSRLAKYFVSGIDIQELILILGTYIYRLTPFALSITCLISAFIEVSSIKKSGEIKAFSSLGLSPQKLFSPIIILSLFLSLFNIATTFIISPYINNSFKTLLAEKKESMSLLSSLSRRLSKDNLYLHVQLDENQKSASDFLLINTNDSFSWVVADTITEDNNGLIFSNSSTFKIFPEKETNESVFYTHSDQTILPKSTLFSLFPKSTLIIKPTKHSKADTFFLIIYSLHPILFTLFGIILALHIYPLISYLFLTYSFIIFTISTLAFAPLFFNLSLFSFALIIPLYLLVLSAHKRGVSA